MCGDSIPDDVRDFIIRFIESIAHIEALLLLRSEPLGACYVSEAVTEDVLLRLSAYGFLDKNRGRKTCI